MCSIAPPLLQNQRIHSTVLLEHPSFFANLLPAGMYDTGSSHWTCFWCAGGVFFPSEFVSIENIRVCPSQHGVVEAFVLIISFDRNQGEHPG